MLTMVLSANISLCAHHQFHDHGEDLSGKYARGDFLLLKQVQRNIWHLSNKYVAKNTVNSVGGQWGGINNHPADTVGTFIGLNGNIFTIPYSILAAPTLGINSNVPILGSSHTHYNYGKGNKGCACICKEIWSKK